MPQPGFGTPAVAPWPFLRDPVRMSTRLLTIPEAADRLACSPALIRRRITAGELTAVRLGASPRAPVRIAPRALDAFLEDSDRMARNPGCSATG